MSEREYQSRLQSLKPFLTLFTVVIGSALLASCGGGGSSDPTVTSATADGPTQTIQAVSGSATVPGAWKGRMPLPVDVPATINTNIDGRNVAAGQILIAPKREKKSETEAYIKSQGWTLLSQGSIWWQVSPNSEELESAIDKYEATGLGFADLNDTSSEKGINDPYSDSTSGYYWTLREIKAIQAWSLLDDLAPGSRGVQVGLVDGGFKFDHEDLRFSAIFDSGKKVPGQSLPGYCFSFDEGAVYSELSPNCKRATHGMHVAGIIAATGNNSKGIAGVAYKNPIKPFAYRVSGGSKANSIGAGFSTLVDNGAKIINISMGTGCDSADDCVTPSIRAKSVNKMIRAIREFYPVFPDVLITQAAGNAGGLSYSLGVYQNMPAGLVEREGYFNAIVGDLFTIDDDLKDYVRQIKAKVLIVGAFDSGRSLSHYSSVPSVVALDNYILAPGGAGLNQYLDYTSGFYPARGVASTGYVGNKYLALKGTSMAAPHVAGVAVLVRQAWPEIETDKLRQIIIDSADNQSGSKWVSGDGYRYLNAERAVQMALAQKNCLTASVATPVVDSQIGALEYVVAPYQSLNLSTISSISPSASYPITSYQWSKRYTGVVAGQNSISATITFDDTGTETVSVAPVLKDGTVCTKSSKSVSITVSQYSKISNAGALVVSSTPAGYGPGDWGCMKDNANGYYYEVKMPSGLRAASRRFTNYTSTMAIQKTDNDNYTYPTQEDIDSTDNTIGYVRMIQASRLCGRTNWDISGVAWNFPYQVLNADRISVWATYQDGGLYCPFGGCGGYNGPPFSIYSQYSPIPWFPIYGYYNAVRSGSLGVILASPPQ